MYTAMRVPIELAHSIIENVTLFDKTKNALLACRLVSKAFSSIATPLAFRVINLSQCNDSSYTFMEFMQEDTQLRELVKELNFSAFPPEDPNEDGVDSVDESSDIFSAIGMFENLQTLRLQFGGEFTEDNPSDDDDGELDYEAMSSSRLFQIRILQELAELGISEVHPNPIRHLEIHGLLALPNSSTSLDGLHRFMQALFTLTLDVVSEPMIEERAHLPGDPYQKFWNGDFVRLTLGRPLYYLTSLTLTSDVPTVGPGCLAWRAMKYLELRRLSLENMIFNDAMLTPTTSNDPSKPSGLESFIRSQTLLEILELKDCSLNIKAPSERSNEEEEEDDADDDDDEDIPPRMWSDVFDGFGKALKNLKSFEFSPFPVRPYTDSSTSNDAGTGYLIFYDDLGYSPLGACELWKPGAPC